MALDPSLVPITAAGVLNFVLAVALFALNPQGRASRVFSLILLVRTGSHLRWAGVALGDPATADLWVRMYAHFAIWVTVLLAYFLLIYPQPRRWAPRPAVTASLLAAIGIVVDLAYLVDHSLLYPESRPAFLALSSFSSFLFALAGLVFALDWTRSGPGPLRRSLFLVALGFALVGTQDGVASLARFGHSIYYGGSASATGNAFALASVAVVAILFGVLAVNTTRREDGEIRRTSRRFLALLLLPTVTGLATGLALVPSWIPGPILFFAGVWRLPLPLLVAYGIARADLFDIDLKIKWTLRRGTLAGVFVAAFLVVFAVAEQFLQEQYGWLVGGVAVGVLLIVLRPIERAADRLADRVMPGVQNTSEYRTVRKREVYRATVDGALLDGAISERGRDMLARLQDQLALTATEAREIEREATAAARLSTTP
ncbi:MAG: hypothetical protein ACT4PT_04250 [Methanobacteriota archaeon]